MRRTNYPEGTLGRGGMLCSRHIYFDETCKICKINMTQDQIELSIKQTKQLKKYEEMTVKSKANKTGCSFHGKNKNPHCSECKNV